MEEPTDETTSSSKESSAGTLFSQFRLVSLCTFFSRVLGLVRDIGMAALFGNGVVMDAFSVAFRVPNLARRLLGEGALSTAFLPMFVKKYHQEGQEAAWTLTTSVLIALTVTLCGIVVLGEAGLVSLLLWGELSEGARLLCALTAMMLPYVIFICLAAQVSAVLHALDHFAWPALLPVLLNVIWIAALCFVGWQLDSPVQQAYWLAGCVLFAGVIQLLAPVPTLFRKGFRLRNRWRESRADLRMLFATMLPVILGLSITQINTLMDSLIAWFFAPPHAESLTMPLPGAPRYPLEIGTASALYFGQRLYQFPLGVFGIALGTVMYPLFARHAERGDKVELRNSVELGLRLVMAIGIPASVGLVLLAEPITVLFFQRGAFDSHDVQQTSRMIVGYGVGVWAYSGLLIVHRGYFAWGDRTTPLKVGLWVVGFNIVLNFLLIWALAGPGLAWASSISAVLQLFVIAWLLQSRLGSWNKQQLGRSCGKTLLCTGVMAVICQITLHFAPTGNEGFARLLRVFLPLCTSVVGFLVMAKLLHLEEVRMLLKREVQTTDELAA